MTKIEIRMVVDPDRMRHASDEWLAMAWHLAQWNPAPIGDHDAYRLVQAVGDEIIRRWLEKVPAEMYHHRHDDTREWLGAIATYEPPPDQYRGDPVEPGTGQQSDFYYGRWVPKTAEEIERNLRTKYAEVERRLAERRSNGTGTPPGTPPRPLFASPGDDDDAVGNDPGE